MRKSFIPISIVITLLLFISTNVPAIETAPRISDRDIIEGLANIRGDIKELKAEQKAIQQQIAEVKDGQKALEGRIGGLEGRIGGLEGRIGGLEGRIDNLIFAVLGCFVALIGMIIWDRRTTLAPAVRKNRELEEREEKVEKALKEYARKEPKLAEILRNVGIL